MKTIFYIIQNLFKKNYFLTIVKKILKRFEKSNSIDAINWAKSQSYKTTEEFCRFIDPRLFDEVFFEIELIKEYANNKISKLPLNLGGGGNYKLLYFLIRKMKPLNIVETGVAAGWTSLGILRAFQKNSQGYLYSSDFPYFRIKDPEQYIGYLAKYEKNKKNWYLDIRGDDIALPEILKKLDNKTIDLFHYDSCKSYSGRSNAIKILKSKFNPKTIIIFDDIQDNFHFRDLVKNNQKSFCVIKFEGKYLGIYNYDILLN
jgi:predicted O-methyltransferase YrrM